MYDPLDHCYRSETDDRNYRMRRRLDKALEEWEISKAMNIIIGQIRGRNLTEEQYEQLKTQFEIGAETVRIAARKHYG